jgi:hypothetical protein
MQLGLPLDPSAERLEQPDHRPQQRGLAAAVGSDNARISP